MVFKFGHFIAISLAQGLVVLLLAPALEGLHVNSIPSAIIAVPLIVAVNGLLWPYILGLSSRFGAFVFPLAVFLFSGLSVIVISSLLNLLIEDGLNIDGLGTGMIVAIALSCVNALFAALFSDYDRAYERYVMRPIMRSHAHLPVQTTPGVIFIEIDGLAEPVLREAIERDRMPTLARWLQAGTHVVTDWEPDLSSQTAASQAGILLGSNEDIPAFRWYDRETGKVLVSSSLRTAALVETRLSRGEGLLVADGASRSNMFSGDTSNSLLTFSTIGRRRLGEPIHQTGTSSYFLFFANPFTLIRLFVFLAYDMVLEWFQIIRQWATRVQPRINRWGIYPLIRASATAASPEINTYMVISDIAQGIPSLYVTYYAYDEVAHHSGVRSPDVWGVLRRLDRHIGRIERAAARANRPYHLVVLSDHGQSNGATFTQRTGETLAQLVERLVPAGYHVASTAAQSEAMGHLHAALTEAETQKTRVASVARKAMTKTTVESDKLHRVVNPTTGPEEERGALVVLASGNLGLIYETSSPRLLTYDEILDRFPGLIPGLVGHDAIGFVRMQTDRDGPLVIGKTGAHWLESGRIEGDDPLTDYGPNAARHLLRHAAFANSPDILVISRYWTDMDEVAAFEELVGSHGGLGGTQTQPFVLHPASLDIPSSPIVGTAELHALFKSWLVSSTHHL